MSSDGATDKLRSTRPARGDNRDIASIALGVLLVLALVATVVMIFSDNPVWTRIGTLAALWAAFLGVFLVARYRRQAATEAARVRDLHRVYELQLEREVSARREHEMVVEKDLRAVLRAETDESVLALRHEIAALREQLGALGVALPEERPAVSGFAAAGELGRGSGLSSVPSERVVPRTRPTPSTEATERLAPVGRSSSTLREDSAPRRPAVRPVSGPGTRPIGGAGSGVRTEPVSQGTAQIPTTPHAPPTTMPTTTPPSTSLSGTGRQDGPPLFPDFSHPGQVSTGQLPVVPVRESAPEEATESVPVSPPSAAVAAAEARSAARAASRHSEGAGTSVADLMARLGGGSSRGGGHRRSAD